jgi:hypothetical protein
MLWCRCLTSRELLKHHQKCTASDCPVCTPVKQYVQKQRMAMQKQQQESLRLREAERHRLHGHGDSRMQVWHRKKGCSDKHLWQPRTRTPLAASSAAGSTCLSSVQRCGSSPIMY